MNSVFYVQYEVRPLPGNENWADAGGAFANCYIAAESADASAKLARQRLVESHWEIVALEEGPIIVTRQRYLDDPQTLECFDEAKLNGECYVYHLWPVCPQDGDAVH